MAPNLPPVRLASIATAVPPHSIDQSEAAALTGQAFAGRVFRTPDLLSIFENTGIRRRSLARPIGWYLEPHDWDARNAVYLEAAEALYVETAEAALSRAGLSAADVGTVVTVSTTGIATPSLEARVAGRLGLSPGVRRVPVFGLGCAGGVSGLSIASRLARSEPGRPVLLVVVELCSLSCRPDEATKTNIVATALFGDGAAACVLVADDAGTGRIVEATGEHLWPDTLDIMGWRTDPAGFGVILDPHLPRFVAERFAEAGRAFFAAEGLSMVDIGRLACHPGGAKVLPAIEAALGLDEGRLDTERAVLAEYGNMSAPTVFFVLERVLEKERGRVMASALGPGFTASFAVIGAAGA